MIDVKPFKAILYNREKFRDFSKLVCPPYDIISKSAQRDYHRLSRYNFIRLILSNIRPSDTKDNNRYTRSAKAFNDWLKKKALVKDDSEGVYFYQQQYKHLGKSTDRCGFIGLLKIDKDLVRPHEHTHSKPKEDRLELIKKVKANLSPIFVLFPDIAGYIKKMAGLCSGSKPLISVKDAYGVLNRLWRVDDKKMLESLRVYMRDKDIFIADGHHRFEVACLYRDMLKYNLPDFSERASYNYIMAYFTDMSAGSLTIMATHRLIKDINKGLSGRLLDKIAGGFVIEKAKNRKNFLELFETNSATSGVFGLYFKKEFYLLRLNKPLPSDKFDCLDVSLFNRFLLAEVLGLTVEDKSIIYSADISESIKLVDSGKAKIAFFLRPTKISQMKEVVLEKRKLPPKSTYFYPKLLSGLVVHKFETS